MKLLREVAGSEQLAILDAAARVAGKSGIVPWLVGGPVRDALLRRRVADLDFTVQSEAERYASLLASELDAAVRHHPRFLTSKITLLSGTEVDITTARSERYPAPGSLPAVAPATIEQDLARRDFTINAIAVRLGEDQIVDPFQGFEDLERRLLRVLHPESFFDDPTRVLRLLRLAARLDFSIEPGTAERMRAALASDALSTVSRERLWRELRLTLTEPDPALSIESIVEGGALRPLIGVAELNAERRERLRRALTAGGETPLDREVMMLAALLDEPAGVEGRLAGCGLSESRIRLVNLLREADPRAERLASIDVETAVSELEKAPEELLALIEVRPEHRPLIEAVRAARSIELPFRTSELELEPGPHIAHALRETRRALVAGRIGPQQALSFARQQALEYLHRRES
ncbi:MAG TPA: hypothetical protein VM557_08325 [Thermoanaerobaculia bacterium]|nr:hypothetical protein [Thermoanaerobaculia bacterium]